MGLDYQKIEFDWDKLEEQKEKETATELNRKKQITVFLKQTLAPHDIYEELSPCLNKSKYHTLSELNVEKGNFLMIPGEIMDMNFSEASQ